MTLTERRFFAKVEQGGDDPVESCWEWRGARNRGGYGHLTINRRLHSAHRWVYAFMVGPIPDGLELDHLCGVPCCVNPWHLEPVTHAVNNARRRPSRVRRAAHSQIRAWATYGFTQATIGQWFGVCQSRISAIVRDSTQYDAQ